MITLTNPRLKHDAEQFDQCKRIALKSKSWVKVVGTDKTTIGWFNQHGDFEEPSCAKLTGNLLERLTSQSFISNGSKRGHRNGVATIGLLARYEAQQTNA